MPTCATSSSISTACSTRRPTARSPAGRAAWSLYRGAGRLAAPLAAPYLARRSARGKEDPARHFEKRGIASRDPFAERPVWLHGVSVGESVAALALAERIVARGTPVVFTTATPNAAARVAPATGERLVHQYAPLDAAPFVARFLAHWQPALALFAESEVWPATLHALDRRAVPRAHVNARLSDRSFAAWQRRPWLATPLFRTIGTAFAQSERQAARFAALGTPTTVATGNLKFDAPAPAADEAALAALQEALGQRPMWLAASTHPGEEEAVVAAHNDLAARFESVATIIAPRHPERAEAVAALAPRATRHSRGEMPGAGIHIADTMGEMGTWFALAEVVFLGGSLVPVGGHNPAEPAAHGAAILTGPQHGEMFEPFVAGGGAQVTDAEELANAVAGLLASPPQRDKLAGAARRILEAERGALDRTLEGLRPLFAEAGLPQ